MKKSEKGKRILEKVEILVATVLFFTMLISCGMYIDIRINGQSSSLPPIPGYEKQILLKKGASENKDYRDNLLEPVFVGIKDNTTKICATFDSEARKSLLNLVNPVLISLFSGQSEQVEFEDETHRYEYIKSLTESDKFVLVSYYDEVHASLFLPCLSSGYEIAEKPVYFKVKRIFVLCDENGNAYGVALSEEKEAYILRAEEKISFDKFSAKEYDVSDGYSYFDFSDDDNFSPVLTSSFMTNKYSVQTLCSKYGKESSALWIDRLFDIFSMNSSFLKSYTSKNNTEINYVDDDNELLVKDDGYVEYSAGVLGVSLEKYLGYSVGESGRYSLSDKIFAVKNFVNSLNFDNSEHGSCVVGLNYEEQDDSLLVYIKSFVNGVAVTENEYDAVFEIKGNYLVYTRFFAFKCTSSQEHTVCLNQSYMNELFEDVSDTANGEPMYYPLLEKEKDGTLYSVSWAMLFRNDEEE